MSERSIELYLDDILDSISAIDSYVLNVDFDRFENERMIYSATIREFQVIGEAVAKIPLALRKKHPDVAWQRVKDFRNILVHEYFGISRRIVWDAIVIHLPKLKQAIQELIKDFI